GLFVDEYERLGMLDAQAWRAARLVVDTGIHAFGWVRDRAIAQLEEAGVPHVDSVIETDRYISMPGQALAYKLGHLEIDRWPAEARSDRRLGRSRAHRRRDPGGLAPGRCGLADGLDLHGHDGHHDHGGLGGGNPRRPGSRVARARRDAAHGHERVEGHGRGQGARARRSPQ